MSMLLTFNIDVQQFSAAALVLNLHRVANCAFLMWSLWTEGLCRNCTSGVWRVTASTLWFLSAAHDCDQSPSLFPPALPAGCCSPQQQWLQIQTTLIYVGMCLGHIQPHDWKECLFPNIDIAEVNMLPGKFDLKWNQFLKPFRNCF